MSEEKKIIELNDEELEKVSGGYAKGNPKEVGFAFYCDSFTTIVYKIAEVGEFFGELNGYYYEINIYAGNYVGYAGSLTDEQIDNYVRQFGQPKSN